ncbi:MAG: amidohydrolase family protein [Desulfoferrobacter sp.]
MIVDFHVHTAYYKTMTDSLLDLMRDAWGDRMNWLISTYSSPEAFLDLMDEAGIDYAVILAELAPITTGIADNEYVAEFCSKSQRLIPFASINPYTCTSPANELERLVHDFGFRGLKLYPTYQYYYPNEPMIYPLYARAQELGIPISLHIGSSIFKGARLKYGDPIFLDDVAVDFPGLVLLQCHSGRPFWYQKSFSLARLHKNIYMEISGLPPKKLLDYFPELERIAHKVIYGSDWPGIPTIKENIEAIRRLRLSDDSKRKILGENAARLLHITDEA